MEKKDITNELKKRTIALSSWMPIVVSIITTLLVTLLLGLLDWDFTKLSSKEYWFETFTTALVGILIYTYAYFNFIRKEKALDGTLYKDVATDHYQYQKDIIQNNKREELQKIVDDENEKNRQFAISKIVIQFGLTYLQYKEFEKSTDLKADIDSYCKTKNFNRIKKRKFRKAINKCIFNDIRYTEISVDDLLNDIDAESDVVENNQVKESKLYHEFDIASKAALALVISVVINILAYKEFDKKFIEILIKNATIIGSNCLSASMRSKKYINYRRIILTNRNNIFSRVTNIKGQE